MDLINKLLGKKGKVFLTIYALGILFLAGIAFDYAFASILNVFSGRTATKSFFLILLYLLLALFTVRFGLPVIFLNRSDPRDKKVRSILVTLAGVLLLASGVGTRIIFWDKIPEVDLATHGVGTKQARSSQPINRIIDGDTFELSDGSKIRLIGIDTPESVHPGMGVEEYAIDAKNYLSDRLSSGNVEIKYDQGYDIYGRKLAYVFVDGQCINEELLLKGLAKSTPEYKHKNSSFYQDLENAAKRMGIGLWGK